MRRVAYIQFVLRSHCQLWEVRDGPRIGGSRFKIDMSTKDMAMEVPVHTEWRERRREGQREEGKFKNSYTTKSVQKKKNEITAGTMLGGEAGGLFLYSVNVGFSHRIVQICSGKRERAVKDELGGKGEGAEVCA